MPYYNDEYNEMQQEQAPLRGERKAKKRRRKRAGLYFALFILLVLTVLGFSVTMFFNVKTITVKGVGNVFERYSEEEIIEASGIKIDSNMLRMNKFKIIEVLEENLPYLKNVTIKRSFPDTIIITVEEAKPCVYVETTGDYIILSEEGKVLENVAERPDCIELLGSGILQNTVGKQAKFKTDTLSEIFFTVQSALKEKGLLEKTKTISIERSFNIYFEYDNWIIVLGNYDHLINKLNLFLYSYNKENPSLYYIMTVSGEMRGSYRSLAFEEYLQEKAALRGEKTEADE